MRPIRNVITPATVDTHGRFTKNGAAEDLDDLQGPGDRRCPAGWVEAAALAMA